MKESNDVSTIKLSKLDQKLLFLVDKNSRLGFSKIGKMLRTSEQRISYTIQSLRNKGIINDFIALIDYSKLGLLSFRVFFKIIYVDEEKFEQLISHFTKDSHISSVTSCGGRYDLICTFMAHNPSEFNKHLKAIMARFSRQLNNYSVLTSIVVRHFGRKYLSPNPPLHELFIGGDRQPYQMNMQELEILGEVAQDARKSSVALAKKVGYTPKTIIAKINKLKEERVISGFSAFLSLEKAGYYRTLLLIKYHNISAEEEGKLVQFCKAHPNIIGLTKTLGEWDLEIEIEVKSIEDFRKIDIIIRKRFPTLIQDIESVPLYKTYKKNMLPKFLLEEKKELT